MDTATPMLQQYQKIKSQHKDCILFYRLGDFYEMFYDDARTASQILDLVLTSRNRGTSYEAPMCGIPYHAAESYIAKLIKAGYKVAICEQVEDPALAKGIVKRDVIRVITSGTFLDENSSDARYLLCLCPKVNGLANGTIGMAFMDPATGIIQANQYDHPLRAAELISRLPVFECIYPASQEDNVKGLFNNPLLRLKNVSLSPHDDWNFNRDIAQKSLCEHFAVHNLGGFGIQELPGAVSSAGALLEYLKQMNRQPLKHIDKICLYSEDEFVYISPAAVYGLELESLFNCVNNALCAMGRRKLRYWLYHPLKKPAAIIQRQMAVTLLQQRPDLQRGLKESLHHFPDLEKSISKLSCGYTHARDLLAIRQALDLLPKIQDAVGPLMEKNPLFSVKDIPGLRQLLLSAVNPDVPLSHPEGKIIHKGYNAELDSLRDIQDNGRQWLRDFQGREIRRTGINSLKVGFNKVFGYYIEITHAHRDSVPLDFIRKQTLVNGERYITPELKEHEEKILNAEEKILKTENQLIQDLQKKILDHSALLHEFCQSVAEIDALFSLSVLAQNPGYTAPEITEDVLIHIQEGRHPVVEQSLRENFVPNDIDLDGQDNHLIILTGPNMAGKSTYIRQAAILVILAQMGSYVPAAKARIGVVDKIFTRIGAHDDITKGQSTFMVEMTEAADILNNLTDRSLVVLDEIGRGTSTFDGLSLAWALAEFLQATRARTLFATHFHELTALADQHSGVKNYNVAVKEWKDEVIFLHKIMPGSSDDSYGIYVAKLAGIPQTVIARAKKILTQLELSANLKERLSGQPLRQDQLSFFLEKSDPIMEQVKDVIQSMDLNTLTPIKALTRLQELKDLVEGKDSSPL